MKLIPIVFSGFKKIRIFLFTNTRQAIFCRGVHCVKSVQIRNFFWSVFSRIRTECGLEKTPYLNTFHSVIFYVHGGKYRKSPKLKS